MPVNILELEKGLSNQGIPFERDISDSELIFYNINSAKVFLGGTHPHNFNYKDESIGKDVFCDKFLINSTQIYPRNGFLENIARNLSKKYNIPVYFQESSCDYHLDSDNIPEILDSIKKITQAILDFEVKERELYETKSKFYLKH